MVDGASKDEVVTMVSGTSIWVVPRSKRDDVSGDRQETGVLTLKVS